MATPHGPRAHIPAWLPQLLKAQALMDAGVRLAAREEAALRGETAACRPGCSGCCASSMPRATAVEMAGALRSLARQKPDALRLVSDALEGGAAGGACPFLGGEGCLVYPMRFLSCRQLLVFGRSCMQGENPLRTRPSDVLVPLRRHAGRAYALLMPFLGEGGGFADPLEMEAALARHLRPAWAFGVRDCLLRDPLPELPAVRAA